MHIALALIGLIGAAFGRCSRVLRKHLRINGALALEMTALCRSPMDAHQGPAPSVTGLSMRLGGSPSLYRPEALEDLARVFRRQ